MRTEQEYLNLEAERDSLAATIGELKELIYPFTRLVKESSGRIPTEKLSFADWHGLTQALATPDHSEVLKRRDAATLDQAVTRMAKTVSIDSGMMDCVYAFEQWAEELRAKDDELLQRHN